MNNSVENENLKFDFVKKQGIIDLQIIKLRCYITCDNLRLINIEDIDSFLKEFNKINNDFNKMEFIVYTKFDLDINIIQCIEAGDFVDILIDIVNYNYHKKKNSSSFLKFCHTLSRGLFLVGIYPLIDEITENDDKTYKLQNRFNNIYNNMSKI